MRSMSAKYLGSHEEEESANIPVKHRGSSEESPSRELDALP